MKYIKNILAGIEGNIVECEADLNRLNDADIKTFKQLLDQSPHKIWVDDLYNLKPFYLNNRARAYFEFTEHDIKRIGFKVYKDFLSSGRADIVHELITFFNKQPKDILVSVNSIKTKKLVQKNIYKGTKTITLSAKGTPLLIMNVFFDLDELLGLSMEHASNDTDEQFIIQNSALYNSLTIREKEILHMIASDQTNGQVAKQLGISVKTVETHRKRVIGKLNVNSAIGLVRYARNFPLH